MTKANAKKATVKPNTAVRKTTETQTSVTTTNNFQNITKGNFHEITVGTPCKIYVDKKTAAMYITPNQTTLVNKRTVTTR